MAEFYFYGSREDARNVLSNIFERRDLRATLDVEHSSRKPKSYGKPEEIDELVAKTNGVIYLTGSFSERPLSLHRISRGPKEVFYSVDITYGGPALGLKVPMCQRRGRLWHLGAGNLWYPRSYWDDAITHPIRPSDELKAAYTDLVKRIKSVTTRRHIGVTLWIGAEGLSLLEKRQALILVKGKWLDVDGKFVKWNQ